MSEGLQGPSYAQDHTPGSVGRESMGRYPPAATVEWSGRDPAKQIEQASPNYGAATNNDQPSALNSQGLPTPFVRQGSNQAAMDVTNALGGRQNDHADAAFEWDENAVEE